MTDFAVVVPWIDPEQIGLFVNTWGVDKREPSWLLLVHDEHRDGCATTKNRGVDRAVELGADIVIVLDDDCFSTGDSLEEFALTHVANLEPQPVDLFAVLTDPPSRGTPYVSTWAMMPVAASMGFWEGVGDYDAARQLVHNAGPMTWRTQAIHGRYFPLSGMNVAFRPADWEPWWRFVDVPRFDDIWAGWMWQREAYRRGCCFHVGKPTVRHSRQSNPWRNLQVEARHLEANETLWQQIATHPDPTYENLCGLLPADPGGSDR